MERIFLASHGSLADGLLGAVELIAGHSEKARAYSLDRYESPSQILEEIRAEIDRSQGPCAILCDINGGSVHNHLMELCSLPGVTLMTGMNLAMAIDLISAPEDSPLEERCRAALDTGAQDMALFDRAFVSQALHAQGPDEL